MSWTSYPQFETEPWPHPPPPPPAGYYGYGTYYGTTPFDQYGGPYQSSGMDNGL